LGQANQLFRFEPTASGGRFVESPQLADRSLSELEVSRGLVVGDVDDSGSPDVLITNNGSAPRLYLNQHRPAPKNWLGVDVLDGPSGRRGLGARVILTTDDGRRQYRTVRRDGSYASSGDPRVLFGIDGTTTSLLEIEWLDGHTVKVERPTPGRYLTVGRDGRAFVSDRKNGDASGDGS